MYWEKKMYYNQSISGFRTYYVKHTNNFKKKKNKDASFLISKYTDTTTTSDVTMFYSVLSTNKQKIKKIMKSNKSINDFNTSIKELSDDTKTLFTIDPSNNMNGFVIVQLNTKDSYPVTAIPCFSNEDVEIRYEISEQNKPDYICKAGVVVYRGLPWFYKNNIHDDTMNPIYNMHSSTTLGSGDRSGISNYGFFSFSGSRITSMASTPTFQNTSRGHDLHTQQDNICAKIKALSLIKCLCKQSEEILSRSGTTISDIILYNCYEKNKYHVMCKNRIVAKYFGSVSDILFL